MLPGVAPTGRPVCVAFVVIVGVENGKIAYEHIYWDQATVLVQLGLLDPAGLPVAGPEAAAKILNPAIPCPHL
jgi:carboxymethylenebutenolidase